MSSEDSDQSVLFFGLIGVLTPLPNYWTVYASCGDPDWKAW